MTETQYKEKKGKPLPRLSRREVDLIAAAYEWTCPACDCLNQEISAPEITHSGESESVICENCGKRFRAAQPEHAYG